MKAINVCAALAVTSLLVLTACSQHDAPSEEVGKAASEMVSAVEGDDAGAPSAAGPFAPRNTCGRLAGAGDFLTDLRTAIEQKDEQALVALTAEDVKLDFGTDSGTGELRRRLNDPRDALWADLAALPNLGCAANGQGGITVPWYFEQAIPVANPADAFIVTGEGVPIYRAPGTDASAVARLDWDLVSLVRTGPEYDGYRHVRLVTMVDGIDGAPPGPGRADALAAAAGVRPDADQRSGDPLSGYIAEGRLRSLLDYRLTAASRNGRWRIISLVSGD